MSEVICLPSTSITPFCSMYMYQSIMSHILHKYEQFLPVRKQTNKRKQRKGKETTFIGLLGIYWWGLNSWYVSIKKNAVPAFPLTNEPRLVKKKSPQPMRNKAENPASQNPRILLEQLLAIFPGNKPIPLSHYFPES